MNIVARLKNFRNFAFKFIFLNMLRTFLSIGLILVALVGRAQVTVNVELKASESAEIQVFVFPLDVETDGNEPMTKTADGILSQTIPMSESGLYSIICVDGTSQLSLPVFIHKNAQMPVKFVVDLNGDCPRATLMSVKGKKSKAISDANLDALYAFNSLYYKQSKEVWTKTGITSDEIREMASKYDNVAQTVRATEGVDENVKQYIDVWSYLQSVELGTVFNRSNNPKMQIFADGNELGEALLPSPAKVLDSPMASLHQSAVNVASQALPKGSLDARLQYINDNYKNPDIREGLQRIVLNTFTRNYDYSRGYQEGLEAITTASEKYGLDKSYVEKFRERASAIPGAMFPDVAFIDASGKAVKMEQFRGKFVYIDLWASWCVPCCKEVPYLQALEKEIENEDIVFVSISTDSSEDPWHKKMEQLEMHGNQWLNTDGKLCDKLNVSSIPHFLIYDREGRLLVYDAPRPSSGNSVRNLLNGLK